MNDPVVIIDYGLGNLLSVQRAFAYCGTPTIISDEPAALRGAARAVLPGVGAFGDGMAGLSKRGFIAPILEYVQSGRPFLGICLGMQMLFDCAEEFGNHQGLGIISGQVLKIPETAADGSAHKIPHIGWNELVCPVDNPDARWQEGLLKDIKQGDSVYYVHSYAAFPSSPKSRVADSWYNGRRIAAVVQDNNVFGCQFHPEKSGPVGLKIIQAFASMSQVGARSCVGE